MFRILYPTRYPVCTQPFGAYNKIYKDNFHHGTDLRIWNDPKKEIMAVYDGMVEFIDTDSIYNWYTDGKRGSPYGCHIILRHKIGDQTYYSLYGHLSEVHCYTDQHISAGQVIGVGGNTGMSKGEHLHFELREGYNDIKYSINPADMFVSDLEGIPPWAMPSVDWCKQKKLMDGTRMDEPITRAEMAVVLRRLYRLIKVNELL